MNIRTLFFILVICFEAFHVSAKKLDNVAILVPSCDKYAEVWSPFFQLLDRNWPGLELPIYLISNTKIHPDPRIHPILIPQEKSWSDNMLQALDQIPEEYVMILLEDYMLMGPVQEERLQQLYTQMHKENAAYLGLVDVSHSSKIPHPTIPGLGYLPPEADYRSSLQACIWKKSILKSILKSGESPWQFELVGIERTRKLKEPFMCVTNNPPLNYSGAIGRGRWCQSIVDYLKSQNIDVQYTLPIETKWQHEWLAIKGWISAKITYPIRKFFGIKWYIT